MSDPASCVASCQTDSECVAVDWSTSKLCRFFDVRSSDADVTLTNDGNYQIFDVHYPGIFTSVFFQDCYIFYNYKLFFGIDDLVPLIFSDNFPRDGVELSASSIHSSSDITDIQMYQAVYPTWNDVFQTASLTDQWLQVSLPQYPCHKRDDLPVNLW